jgi:hypothetical protein
VSAIYSFKSLAELAEFFEEKARIAAGERGQPAEWQAARAVSTWRAAAHIVRNTELEDARTEALEAALMALGRAGGNTLGSPHRAAWEKVRAAL